MKKFIHDQIPTYEELKALDKEYEYHYVIFNLLGSSYICITYNEDNTGKISLDYMEGSYLHSLGYTDYEIFKNFGIKNNLFYKLTKTNYNKIIKCLQFIKNIYVNELNKYGDKL